MSGSYAGGLYAPATFAIASALISLFWLHIPKAVVVSEEPGVVPAE